MRRRIATLGIALLLAPEAAAGQELTSRDRALVLFEESEELYRERRFAEAAVLLRQAYALSEEPVLLYNLARALDRAGDRAEALAAYERYLADAPEGPTRRRAQAAVGRLRAPPEEDPEPPDRDEASPVAALAAIGTARSPAPGPAEPLDGPGPPGRGTDPAPTRATPDAPGGLAATPLTADAGGGPRVAPIPFLWLGVGGLGFVAAGITWAVANDRSRAADRAPSLERTVQLHGRAQTLADWTTGLLIASGVTAGVGVVWLVVQLARGSPTPPTQPLAWRW
ncbi:MAG: tetratricopeptide repeat protein [Sandaracinaceae bacterium]